MGPLRCLDLEDLREVFGDRHDRGLREPRISHARAGRTRRPGPGVAPPLVRLWSHHRVEAWVTPPPAMEGARSRPPARIPARPTCRGQGALRPRRRRAPRLEAIAIIASRRNSSQTSKQLNELALRRPTEAQERQGPSHQQELDAVRMPLDPVGRGRCGVDDADDGWAAALPVTLGRNAVVSHL